MKAITLVLCILALLGSAASGFFWWQVGDTKKQLQGQLAAEQARATALQADLTKTADEKNAIQSNLITSDTALGDTKSRLTASEARTIQIARETEALKKTITIKEASETKLSADLDALRRELVQTRLASQVGNPEEIEKYKQTVASLEARLTQFQTPAAAVAQGDTTTAPKGVTPASSPAGSPSERTAAARVAQVGPKNAFVVIDLGTADGIVVGNKFLVTRGGQTIAEGAITQVNEANAIVNITPSSIKNTLKAGDIASLSK